MSLIQALHPDSFIGWSYTASTPYCGQSSLAYIDLPSGENQAIVRAFPADAHRGLLNQCIYWIISSALGIHTSPQCWLMPLYTEFLHERWPGDWPASDMVTVLVEELPSATVPISQIGWSQAEAVSAALRAWNELTTVVAMHEWLAHHAIGMSAAADIGNGQFTLTDGQAILGSNKWVTEQLDRLPQPINRLAWLAWGGTAPDMPTLAKLHVAGEQHGDLFRQVAAHVMYITWELTDRATMLAVFNALRSRAAEDFIAQRFGGDGHARHAG